MLEDVCKKDTVSCLLNLNGGSAPPVVNNDIAVCSPGGISFFLKFG